MKSKIKSAVLLFSGVATLAVPAMAAVTLETGSLAIAFYKVTGTNAASVGANTYVFDLGQASLYRDNTNSNIVSVSTVNTGIASNNIANDLVTAFGSGWATDSTVRWMVVGGRPASTGAGADPASTLYFSYAASATPVFPQQLSTSLHNQANGSLNSFFNGVQNKTAGDNADGTVIAKSATNSVDEFLKPTVSTNFKMGTNIYQSIGSYGTGVVGALDIFRFEFDDVNGDPSTGSTIGKLTLSSTGDLKISGISAVPEPSGALALGLIGTIGGLGYRSRRKNTVA